MISFVLESCLAHGMIDAKMIRQDKIESDKNKLDSYPLRICLCYSSILSTSITLPS
jgi:hypothetical protein